MSIGAKPDAHASYPDINLPSIVHGTIGKSARTIKRGPVTIAARTMRPNIFGMAEVFLIALLM
jgi:hypothetical protein